MQSIKVSDIYMAAMVAAAIGTFSGQAYAESKVLNDPTGMTVYTFDKDSAGKSNCHGDCATAWPPVAASAVPAGPEVGVIARDDGSKQAAYKGKPLYLFAGDKKPGDMNGDNVQNVWHAINIDGKPVTASPRQSGYSSGYSYDY